jgi:diguanylate cyclase (GGDEF)-like protein
MLAGRGLTRLSAAGEVEGLLAAVAERRQTVLVTGLGAADSWLASHLPEAQHLMLVPLAVDGEVEEVLVLEHGRQSSGGLKRSTVTTIERFAAHGALALRNAKLHSELVAMARTDGLTGLANRIAFDQALVGELERLARNGGSLALVLCDVDHFKKINDEFGHQVGDSVLTEAARTLREVCRTYDLVARYGGEEFAIVMPLTTTATATDVAERLRAAVAAIAGPAAITMSFGLAVTEEPVAAGEMVAAADLALYRAKREGRNRVAVAGPGDSTATRGSGVRWTIAGGTPSPPPDG